MDLLEWVGHNLVLVILYIFIIFNFIKIGYSVYKNIKQTKSELETSEIPDCTLLISQYLANNGNLNYKLVLASLIDLCKKDYIYLNPIIDEKERIYDYEIIRKDVPIFKDDDYEKNIFNDSFKNSNIKLSHLYILNKYVFFNKKSILYSEFEKTIKEVDLNDELLLQIVLKELIDCEIINDIEKLDLTEKGEEISKNITGLRIFLKKYNLIDGYKNDDIEIWGKYFTYGVMYGIENLSISRINTLYTMGYFGKKIL